MTRLTRNSYKRKIILFGIFIFVSIALISTGFAAWVMSSDATDNSNSNVDVGLVNDASLKIELTNKNELQSFKFLFEPAAGDNTGRVRLDKETNLTEQLSFTIQGKISNVEILDKLTILMVLPSGMQKAIDLNYIVPDACVGSAQEIDVQPDGSFEYTLKFTWGTAFKGQNPSLYYDNDVEGQAIPDAEVKEVLENLRACVFNYYDELNAPAADRTAIIEAHKADELPKFTVTIVAAAN